MNTLGFGLLSLLSRDSNSGYDLMRAIQPFWQAKHSQIYPLLAKMEKEGYVEHVLVEQSDKPDKKIYSITPAGTLALQNWLKEPTAAPAQRDEMLIKAYSLWLSDHETARRLFEDRIASELVRLKRVEGLRDSFHEEWAKQSIENPDLLSPAFTRYLLIRRRIEIVKSEIEWCHWALELVDKSAARHRPQE
jgi:PadR family transcriptional regulator, regulatory protein AphA